MSATNIIKKLRLYVSMVRYGRAHNRDFAREHWEFFRDMDQGLKNRGIPLKGARVLDLGCGKSAWLTLLCQSAGAQATGIDTEVVRPGKFFSRYKDILMQNGPERALRTLVWEGVFARPYFKELAGCASFPLDFHQLDARAMSASAMEFPDKAFDLVCSHEVLEHIEDVEGAARELARVLKPGGLTWLYVHNFASISGGHHIAWKYPDTEPSQTVPAWDHLRQNRFPDIPSWINRLREKAYLDIFKRYFDIIDWLPTHTEGESLLADDILSELSDFTPKELLTKGFIIVGTPKENK